MKYVVVFVTAPSKKQARKIACEIVKERLAACASIIEGIESTYWWQGKIEKANETLIIMKTKSTLAKKLIKKVRALHSYVVPEIICVPIIDGNPEYLKWVEKETMRI